MAANFEALCAMQPKQLTPWARVRRAHSAHVSAFGTDANINWLRYCDKVQRQYPIVYITNHAITVAIDGQPKSIGWDLLFEAAFYNDDYSLRLTYRALLLTALGRWQYRGQEWLSSQTQPSNMSSVK